MSATHTKTIVFGVLLYRYPVVSFYAKKKILNTISTKTFFARILFASEIFAWFEEGAYLCDIA